MIDRAFRLVASLHVGFRVMVLINVKTPFKENKGCFFIGSSELSDRQLMTTISAYIFNKSYSIVPILYQCY